METFLYSCNPAGGGKFWISKLGDNHRAVRRHLLLPSPRNRMTCDCEGWTRHGNCRHLDILNIFVEAQKAGKGYLLDYDRKRFTKFVGA